MAIDLPLSLNRFQMRIVILLCIFCILTCDMKKDHPLGLCSEYFPEEVTNSAGAVWKYYIHLTPKDGQRKTNIKYRKIGYINQQLLITDHSADFLESYKEVITTQDNKWKVDSTITYDYRSDLDSLRTPMIYNIGEQNVILNWKESTANLNRSISNGTWKNNLQESHFEVKDSLVDGLKVKTFYGKLESNFQNENDTSLTTFNWYREFTEGRGMTSQYVETDRVKYEWDIDEIISIEEFDRRAQHGTHRVAYIDPDQAIDNQDDFTTCYHISKINDYYNDDRAQHIGGKGGLWELLENKLNPKLLKGQEGYLTYRFVVNCEGRAGRFITEEAGLNFDRIEFSSELKKHLLELLLEVPKWKNLTVNSEPRDAYVYVTFKIKNDEIIEILP